MDLMTRITKNIETLRNPEEDIFSFDDTTELLLEITDNLKSISNEKNVLKEESEGLKSTVASLTAEKGELEKDYNECRDDLTAFVKIFQEETVRKMKLLGYADDEIEKVYGIDNFKELHKLRESVFSEFDAKFTVNTEVKTTPERYTLKITDFKH